MEEPTPEIPQQISFLPVTKEAAELALSEIAANPNRALMEEGTIIQTENPQLNQLLHLRIQAGVSNQNDYIEGALWTHRILRKQAEQGGGKLPVISSGLTDAYLVDNLERVESRPEISIDQDSKEQAEKLMTEEPELGNALAEITKYRPSRGDFDFGATDVYFVVKKALGSKIMGGKFKT